MDYIREPLKAGLQDRSPYVRRTAVMGCVKLFYFAPEFIKSKCQHCSFVPPSWNVRVTGH